MSAALKLSARIARERDAVDLRQLLAQLPEPLERRVEIHAATSTQVRTHELVGYRVRRHTTTLRFSNQQRIGSRR
jgi:hypothetical protein